MATPVDGVDLIVFRVDGKVVGIVDLAGNTRRFEVIRGVGVDIDLEKKLIYVQDTNYQVMELPTLLETFGDDNDDVPNENIIPFDAVSIDIGSTSRGLLDTPGAKVHTIPTRPISALVERFENATAQLQAGTSPGPVNVIVVGAGAAGIELSMSVHGRWKELLVCECVCQCERDERGRPKEE